MAKPKDSAPGADAGPTSFEDAFHRLTEMAEQLEAGGLSLAEATARFEEGMDLVQRCNELLNNAELKITELKEAHRPDGAQRGLEGGGDPDDDPEDDSEED